MTYRIELTAAARRCLERLPPKVLPAVVEFLTHVLPEAPLRVGKPLRGERTGQWSARRGEYRILYTVHDDIITVKVISIRHRRDASADAQRFIVRSGVS